MKKTLLFLVTVMMSLSMMAQTTYTKVTSASELSAGDKVLLVGFNEGDAYVMSYQKTNNRHAVEISVSGDEITAVVATDPDNQTDPYEITIGMEGGNFTFFDEVKGGYLYAPGGGNYLKTQTTLDDKGMWTLSMEEDGFVPVSAGEGIEQNIMRFNINNSGTGTPLFGCYKPTSSVVGLVYIFKAGGAPVINPEPSNYPTAFYSSCSGTSVTLDWVDATGAQLPQKYLVLASTGSIQVPVDGTPVANGPLAKNVNYGVEIVTFDNLNPGTTYHFAIFPYTNSGANINYKTSGSYPTATETTEFVYELLNEGFDEGLGVFTAYSVIGEQEWHQATYNNVTYANMNGYANQQNNENEDWLISPQIVLGNTVYQSVNMDFRTAMKFDGDPLRVMIGNYAGGDPNNTDWTEITSYFEYSTGNYAWVESGVVDIKGMIPEDGQFNIAFVYTSSTEAANSWEIDYVRLEANEGAGVEENAAAAINVYPNPASSNINIVVEVPVMAQIVDMTGRVVMNVNLNEGENNVNVADFADGVYFVRMNGAVVKFVKR